MGSGSGTGGKKVSKGFEHDRRYPQADREAWITLGLYGVYFVWWYACAYGLGGGDPEEYTYVCGFPAWFFYSCVLGYPVLTLVLWFVVRYFFKKMPLDADLPDPDDDADGTAGTAGTVGPRAAHGEAPAGEGR